MGNRISSEEIMNGIGEFSSLISKKYDEFVSFIVESVSNIGCSVYVGDFDKDCTYEYRNGDECELFYIEEVRVCDDGSVRCLLDDGDTCMVGDLSLFEVMNLAEAVCGWMDEHFVKKPIPLCDSAVFRSFKFPDGRMCGVLDIRYDCKVDLSDMTYIPHKSTDEFAAIGLPTMQTLVDTGLVLEVSCIEKECEIDFDYDVRSLSESDIDKVVSDFSELHGVDVSRDAVVHNYHAWLGDYKSGYRDEALGYHLFSPCGCNALSFRYSSLHELCSGWQTTYVC